MGCGRGCSPGAPARPRDWSLELSIWVSARRNTSSEACCRTCAMLSCDRRGSLRALGVLFVDEGRGDAPRVRSSLSALAGGLLGPRIGSIPMLAGSLRVRRRTERRTFWRSFVCESDRSFLRWQTLLPPLIITPTTPRGKR